MSIPTCHVCAACGAAYFPARLRCHRCGGWDFSASPVEHGIVSGSTHVYRAPAGSNHDWLVEVRVEPGVVLLAAGAAQFHIGELVQLVQRADGAILAERGKTPAPGT